MKYIHAAVLVGSLAGPLALVSGCGGDDDSPSGGTGGSATGGAAGDAGTGGTSSGGASSGGTSTGGTGEGGEAGGPGDPGDLDDEDCPAMEPEDGDSCAGLAGTGCNYDDSYCVCPTFGPGMGNWQCITESPDECDGDTQPMGICTDPGAYCSFNSGSGFCYCNQTGGAPLGAWTCLGG